MTSYRRRLKDARKILETKVFHATGFFDLMFTCRQRFFPVEARPIFDPINEWGRDVHMCNQVMEEMWNELDMGDWDQYLREHPLPENPYNVML